MIPALPDRIHQSSYPLFPDARNFGRHFSLEHTLLLWPKELLFVNIEPSQSLFLTSKFILLIESPLSFQASVQNISLHIGSNYIVTILPIISPFATHCGPDQLNLIFCFPKSVYRFTIQTSFCCTRWGNSLGHLLPANMNLIDRTKYISLHNPARKEEVSKRCI